MCMLYVLTRICCGACRYLIQNLTGLNMSYWAPQPHGRQVVGVHSLKRLKAGDSEELQVCLATATDELRWASAAWASPAAADPELLVVPSRNV
jgi:hypothetical protein